MVPAAEPAQPTLEEQAGSSAYTSEHIVPEPIEMPPAKAHVDVSEVLASVQGSFNFVQDSMVVTDQGIVDFDCKWQNISPFFFSLWKGS